MQKRAFAVRQRDGQFDRILRGKRGKIIVLARNCENLSLRQREHERHISAAQYGNGDHALAVRLCAEQHRAVYEDVQLRTGKGRLVFFADAVGVQIVIERNGK